MARRPRFDLAGVAQHVVQRGNHRLPCFLDDDDRQRYLQCLIQALSRFDCRLHAYVLMGNHVHLLLTPDSVGAVSHLMHTFGRNYTGLFNGRHGRTGTLWEGPKQEPGSECSFPVSWGSVCPLWRAGGQVDDLARIVWLSNPGAMVGNSTLTPVSKRLARKM
jgi:REP element-mobilizing transposase RayT